MSSVTLPQIADVIKKIDMFSSKESLDELNKSGLLTDLLAAPAYAGVDRKAFQALLKTDSTVPARVEAPTDLTQEVKRIAIPAIERFSLEEWFNAKKAKVPIAYVAELNKRFGQIETDIPAATAVFHRLTRLSQFDNVWKSLSNPAELSPGQIAWLIDNDQLRTDGEADLFKFGSSLVGAFRDNDGWCFDIYPSFRDGFKWRAGRRVIYRDSEAPSL